MTARSPGKLALTLVVLGALAGLSGWALGEGWRDGVLGERRMLFLTGFAAASFGIGLALTGPLRLRRVALPALGCGVVLAGLLWWAAGRHADVSDFLDLGYPLLCFGMALVIVTPFLLSLLSDPEGWRSYPVLFAQSWQIAVRFLAGALFTALFWGLLSLSDALLQIVGLPLMEMVTRHPPVTWALTGAVFGLALAAVHEMAAYLAPDLVLRLLRLFVPVVLLVVAVFLVALPVQGWDGLVRGFSPAATLMAFGIAAVVLVTVAVDRNRQEAVQAPLMRWATVGLAALVLVLAALAVWAIWMRVSAYGWTPARLMAFTVAAVLVVYGIGYVAALVLRAGWMARIREVNIWMALATLAVCVIWLTPLFVPERISAEDQAQRALAGLPARALALDELAGDWGLAGQAAQERIAAARPELADPETRRLARGSAAPAPSSSQRARLLAILPVYPGDMTLGGDALRELGDVQIANLLRACDNRLSEGPGCALYFARFLPGDPQARGLVFRRVAPDQVEVGAVTLRNGRLLSGGTVAGLGGEPGPAWRLRDAHLAALHRGEAVLEPRELQVLRLGDRSLFAHN
ncbi:DUF4153 domain-containing protein [Pseudoponticoccus marisrubri]|uniref:DUF4153 domain-containing protein n=1 Tax=Pseudoponticoccus marisrubri TaxID=1685382 RepID=A0A0W7WNM7_9RHOB|nr:DUF4153 domain-containing protein [Pseudoponticoccus marisrubri]KUF12166.1 hypothetical protein AVJ23_00045 [Pseudoponticoccus marisrubri]